MAWMNRREAWFRQATALAGMGKLDEAQAALDAVEKAAAWRRDYQRIQQTIEQRRAALSTLTL
eukprot:4476268-Amphidinium_carterae.1